jgi:protein-S-isoprenylcysteine O-methyltransferase Ste14
MFNRIAVFVYGVACYAVSLATFIYMAGFLGNFRIPASIDSSRQSPLALALLINFALIAVFAIQHSVMSRPWFKSAWTRIVPQPAERSTYLFFSCAAMLLLIWKWQPMGGVLWNVQSHAGRITLNILYAAGWVVVLAATFLIDHFDLFGLRQIWLNLVGTTYTSLKFRTPGMYRHVRHPLYLGWLLVFWSAPLMTSAHLFFAMVTSAYIFVAIQFEERDLVRAHREYAEYREHVPMIIPIGGSRHRVAADLAANGD